MLATRARMAAGGIGGVDQYSIDFNATTTKVGCGSDASLDDLHDAAMTVEAWIKLDGYGESNSGHIVTKRGGTATVGWLLMSSSSTGLVARIFCTGTNAEAQSGTGVFPADGSWYHVAFGWNDASDNAPRIWIDGTEQSNTTIDRSDVITSDASRNLTIGNNDTGSRTVDGQIAWVRISDNIRYTTGFTPPARLSPPAIDGNTVEQWNFNAGSGVTASAEVNGSNDGTITDGSWIAL